jgi:DNA adenine methylase
MKIKMPLIKYHGGSWHSYKWFSTYFPANYEDMNYYELFAGGASPLLRKNPSRKEYLNEINPGLYELWKAVIEDPQQLIYDLSQLEYSQKTFESSIVDSAVATYVKYRMSRGGTGNGFAKSNRLRGGVMGDLNAWRNSIYNIPFIHSRMKNVILTNGNALDALKTAKWTSNDFLLLDPPFLPETRKSPKVYEYEMSRADHEEMLGLIKDSPAKIILLGYNSTLYNSLLNNWTRHDKLVTNNSGQTKTKSKRMNSLWINY